MVSSRNPESPSHLNGKGQWEVSGPSSHSEQVTVNHQPGFWAWGSMRITLLLPLLPLSSSHVLSALPQTLESKEGEGCFHLSCSPSHQTPKHPVGSSREVSHTLLCLRCFSSYTMPLHASATSCCAKHDAASDWLLPKKAALYKAGPDLQKHFCLFALIRL